MEYTWQDVMFGIDTQNEAARKATQQKDIERKMADEASAMSGWSLGLSLLGAVLFGPAGYAAGKILGRQGADWGWFGGDYHDWEDMEIEEGKFFTKEAKELNELLDDAAKDQDKGQIISAIVDLGKMYVQAGGFTAEPGELDFTTFGSGADEWTVFGRQGPPTIGDQVSTVAPGPGGAFRQVDVTPVTFESDVASLWDKDIGSVENLQKLWKTGGNIVGQESVSKDFERILKEGQI